MANPENLTSQARTHCSFPRRPSATALKKLQQARLPSLPSFALLHFHRYCILRGARAEDPADHHSHEQDDGDEDEVRRRHVGEIHGRLFTICADSVRSSCSTLPSLRHIVHA